MNARIAPLLSLSLTLLSAHEASASLLLGDTIGIDFDNTGNFNGPSNPSLGVAPEASTNFNHFDGSNFQGGGIANGTTATFANTLINTDGQNVTGVTFSLTNNTGRDTNRALSAQGGNPGGGLFTDSSIVGDRIISNDAGSGRITDGDDVIDGVSDRAHFVLTFTGLDQDLTYDLSGGYDVDNAGFDAIWQADGQTFTTNGAGSSVGYDSLFGLSPDLNGALTINVVRRNNNNGSHVTVGALSLTAVPEVSSSLALSGLFALFFLRRQRR